MQVLYVPLGTPIKLTVVNSPACAPIGYFFGAFAFCGGWLLFLQSVVLGGLCSYLARSLIGIKRDSFWRLWPQVTMPEERGIAWHSFYSPVLWVGGWKDRRIFWGQLALPLVVMTSGISALQVLRLRSSALSGELVCLGSSHQVRFAFPRNGRS